MASSPTPITVRSDCGEPVLASPAFAPVGSAEEPPEELPEDVVVAVVPFAVDPPATVVVVVVVAVVVVAVPNEIPALALTAPLGSEAMTSHVSDTGAQYPSSPTLPVTRTREPEAVPEGLVFGTTYAFAISQSSWFPDEHSIMTTSTPFGKPDADTVTVWPLVSPVSGETVTVAVAAAAALRAFFF